MATATLELVNPYSKYGFKRRPTYNEIIGLINENETITGQLPDRTATLYKASPEGSFFDGTDALELMKEQQNRISQRQLQELLLKQNTTLRGLTYNLERLRQSSSSSSSSSTPVATGEDRGTLSLGLQTDLQQREAQLRDRQQQTGEAHRSLLSRATTPVIDGLFSSLSRQSSRIFPRTGQDTPSDVARIFEEDISPRLRQPQPQQAETFIIGSESEGEMMTARANNEDLIVNSLRFNNPNATDGEIKRVSNVLLKYSYLTPEQIAIDFNNFNILHEIYGALNRNGIISDDDMDNYQALTSEISEERKGRKRASLLRKLSEDYKRKIYDKYINNISNRPVEA